MRKMMMIWFILAISLVGTLTYIGFRYQDSVADYQAQEQDMIEAANIYFDQNEIKLSYPDSIKIKSDKLLENNYLSTMKVKDEECTGYVVIKKTITDYDVKAYLKCQNYTTVDYVE